MQVEIGPFEITDYPAARALWERTPGVGLSAADEADAVEAYLRRNPALSLVARVGGELAGTVLCGHDGRRGLIHHLVTAESHRRRGIGRLLLGRALQGLHAAGIGKCHVLVITENHAGKAFWRQIGAEERLDLSVFSISTGI